MSEQISIEGLDKAQVLAALFNHSKQQGMGFYDRSGASQMTAEQAAKDIERMDGRLYFDYHLGRVMKVDIAGDSFSPRLYDRDNGQGAAAAAIDSIRQAKVA